MWPSANDPLNIVKDTLMLRTFLSLAVATVLAIQPAMLANAGCGTCDKTIVENAVENDDFSTLVAAVKAGGLVEALSGEGPFTVFAPTNEAFAKLPEGTVKSLLKPENKDKLVAILKLHVVKGVVKASDVVKLKEAKTLGGETVKIKVEGDKVMINGAQVVKTDIKCKNGMLHVVDSVILPVAAE
jgi:uncharacterized surface protein with fasciclin (FAS1) repeats